ncbi:hypothetical protein A3B33_02405 [Candidatus Adlerbacteria bacterium RIFCSPLOWO2_01_FULL_54_16]|uniref:Uncharacterized protein n=2 Tax=Parcubacteria group TaxID=1794811 RepID=A0A1F4Y0T9_9BACT|nr:MAG: hypothetical protein A3B33_02405 [Candidatus Adlerbacteria bacterium RIFCSPLOWO2_01_FULL_54_16]
MTPSTSLTLEGFLRGLQAQSMWLIGSIVFILVALWLIRSIIAKSVENGMSAKDAQTTRGFVNWAAGLITVLVLIGFAFNAANYATNLIPRSGLDKSSIYQDMDSNIQKR